MIAPWAEFEQFPLGMTGRGRPIASTPGGQLSAISGHKSMQMLKRYTHIRAEDLVERFDRLKKKGERK